MTNITLFPLDWEAQGRLVYIPLGGGRGQWQTAHNALHAQDLVTAHNAASAEWRRLYYELEDRLTAIEAATALEAKETKDGR